MSFLDFFSRARPRKELDKQKAHLATKSQQAEEGLEKALADLKEAMASVADK